MATTDALRRLIPEGGDPADLPYDLGRYSLTDTGLPIVTSQADAEAFRAAYNTAIQGIGLPRQPVLVYRSDLRQIHLNHNDGSSAWEYMAGRQHGATVNVSRTDVANDAVRNVYVDGFARMSPGFEVSGAARVVLPATGMYTIFARGSWSGTASNLGRTFLDLLQGSDFMIDRGSSANESVVSVSANWPFTAGDTVGLNCYHEAGGNQNFTGVMQISMINAPAW